MKLISNLYLIVMGFTWDSRYESVKKNELEMFEDLCGSVVRVLLIPHEEMDHKMFPPCILVIDNDVNLLVKLEAVLKRAGYRVLTANNGRHGIYLAQAALPEVIVCEVTDVFNVRSTLAQDSQTASISFVFLTKPLDKSELVASVNAVIRSQPVR
jgi:CheY-like chemotaxis protein